MPFVNPNRVYQVRSAPRSATAAPIHTVALPDAAGAHHNAMMPGLQAGLQASQDQLRTRQALAGQRTALVQNLIGLGGQIATTALNSYERAAARRDALAVQRAESAYVAHMNEADAAAESAAYDPGGEGREIGGPSTVIRARERAFDETDAYKALTDSQRQAFEERRAVRQGVYFNRADRIHRDKRLAFNQEQADLAAKNSLDAVQRAAADPADEAAWNDQVALAVESDQERRRVAMRLSERPDPAPTPAEQTQLDTARLAMRQGLAAARLQLWSARIAADPDPAEGAHPLEAEVRKRLDGLADPALRAAAEDALAKAAAKRETTRAAVLAKDNKRADALAERVGSGRASEEESKEYDALLARLPESDRAARENTRAEADGIRAWAEWSRDFVDTFNDDREDGPTMQETLLARAKARAEAAKLPTEKARKLAEASLAPFDAAADEYRQAADAKLYALAALGSWDGADMDARTARAKIVDAAESGLVAPKRALQLLDILEKRSEEAAAPGRGARLQAVMRRYLHDSVVDEFTQIGKGGQLEFAKSFNPSRRYDTPERWTNRSNAVIVAMVDAIARFDRLQAAGRLKPEETLDSFVGAVMGNNADYAAMTDDEVIGAFAARIGELNARATEEHRRELDPSWESSLDSSFLPL